MFYTVVPSTQIEKHIQKVITELGLSHESVWETVTFWRVDVTDTFPSREEWAEGGFIRTVSINIYIGD